MATNSTSSSANSNEGRIGCFMMVGIVGVIILIEAMSGSSSPPATPPPAAIPAQQGAAGPDNPAAQKAEASYLTDLQAAGVPLTKMSTGLGYSVCLVVKLGTPADDAATQLQSQGLDSEQANALVQVAQKDLCSQIQ